MRQTRLSRLLSPEGDRTMTYSKLYVNGKRDPRRRYIDEHGNIVSRRQAETAIFGESPSKKPFVELKKERQNRALHQRNTHYER